MRVRVRVLQGVVSREKMQASEEAYEQKLLQATGASPGTIHS
jgi:hypothetical protein